MDRIFVIDGQYASARDHSAQSYVLALREFSPRSLDRVEILPCGTFEQEINRLCMSLGQSDAASRMVPVGTLPYVRAFLDWQRQTGVMPRADSEMTPMEVPACIRSFLRRRYAIVTGHDIPRGRLDADSWFVKDASHLKRWAGVLPHANFHLEVTHDDSLYVVSERVDFLSEWRVFVLDGEILGCNHYLGDPICFPNADTLASMVRTLEATVPFPTAYTLDIGVRNAGQSLVTEPFEVHPFSCCGLYGFYDRDIPKMLECGYDWYASGKSLVMPLSPMHDADVVAILRGLSAKSK